MQVLAKQPKCITIHIRLLKFHCKITSSQHQIRHTTFKMSVVSLLGVNVMNNPAKFTDKYEFEITFECLEALQKGLCTSRPRSSFVLHTVPFPC